MPDRFGGSIPTLPAASAVTNSLRQATSIGMFDQLRITTFLSVTEYNDGAKAKFYEYRNNDRHTRSGCRRLSSRMRWLTTKAWGELGDAAGILF
jgi:hypothetical protein